MSLAAWTGRKKVVIIIGQRPASSGQCALACVALTKYKISNVMVQFQDTRHIESRSGVIWGLEDACGNWGRDHDSKQEAPLVGGRSWAHPSK